MIFDIGAQRDALMPIRLFKKKLPCVYIYGGLWRGPLESISVVRVGTGYKVLI